MPKKLFSLLALEGGIGADGTQTVPLFWYGDTLYDVGNGEECYHFDAADCDRVVKRWQDEGVDIAVDYNHQQLHAKTNGRPAPASGWITRLTPTEHGCDATIKWTPRALEAIRNKEFRYLSPTFFLDSDNHIAKIYNVALTNRPATVNAPELVAAEQSPDASGD